ncbi:MAG: COG0784: FOG: CheY-like receiver [uncultured Microvirga sp.]|uniref:COG0784: FOG: CheY-like receiver n=1 Tax=uncultured Microvirga sp. TaxID=412392 RepID=A0A6J4LLS3_9HYPH|nr:MAG: COG0784: FOG: CheY-like receiver [uncultured Microvirga sp.]
MVACASATASPGSGSVAKSKSVLLVEDEALLCELMTEALEAQGHRVYTAEDVDGAARLLAQERIDLLFTDLDLARGSSGLTLAHDARAGRPELPIIYTSGRQALAPGQAVPGSVFVPKPYRPAMVCTLVNRLVASEAA